MPLVVLLVLVGTPRANLVWSSSTSACREPALRTAVATRLGYDPFVPEAVGLQAEVAITGAATLTGRLTVVREGRPKATRQLSGPADCTSLIEALAHALAVVIDPLHSAAPRTVATPDPALPTPRETLPVPAPEPRPVEPPAPQPSWVRVALHAQGQLELGQHPQPTASLAAGVRLGGSRVFGTVEGLVLVPSRGEAGGASVDVFSVGGDVAGCVRLSFVSGCLSARFLGLRFEGRQVDSPQVGWLPAISVGPRVGVEWPRETPFAVTAAAELRAAVTRPRLLLGDVPLWEQPFILGTVSVGALARLP